MTSALPKYFLFLIFVGGIDFITFFDSLILYLYAVFYRSVSWVTRQYP